MVGFPFLLGMGTEKRGLPNTAGEMASGGRAILRPNAPAKGETWRENLGLLLHSTLSRTTTGRNRIKATKTTIQAKATISTLRPP